MKKKYIHTNKIVSIACYITFTFLGLHSFAQVGIGTTAPSYKFHLKSTGTTTGLHLNATHASNGDPEIRLQKSGTSIFALGVDDADNDNFKIGTTALETSTRFSLKSDGNVGIGIGNPMSKFQISGSSGTADIVLLENAEGGAAGDIAIGFTTNATRRYTIGIDNSATADDFLVGTSNINTSTFIRLISSNKEIVIGSGNDGAQDLRISKADGGGILLLRNDATTVSGDFLGGIGWTSNDGAPGTTIEYASCAIQAVATEDHSSTAKGAKLVFRTSPSARDENVNSTEIMEIDQSGNVGIGVSAASHILQINGQGEQATQSTWATSSDERVKENICDVENGLKTVLRFRAVTFDYKKDYLKYNKGFKKHNMGFIAQECAEIRPAMVKQVNEKFGNTVIDDFNVLNTSALRPLLVKAIQERQLMIEEQQCMIETLNAENKIIEEKLNQLEASIK